jgi:glycosyltransferase involved in cell wall biosynthesis
VPLFKRWAKQQIFAQIGSFRTGRNRLVDSYLEESASAICASRYSLAGQGKNDLFRDLIVLKRATAEEKGVILLKYSKTFDAVVALFDLDRLMARYIFVLEPCWAGYSDPSVLMFIHSGHPVFVQCFTDEDHRFIQEVGAPLVPVRLGPADWVDAELFAPGEGIDKQYDLVMVANWGRHKRHAQLFRALREIGDSDIRVLLIGFPWAGRTAADVKREAASIGAAGVKIDVVEQVSAAEVARLVSQCKAFVFLSRKEGDNKALVEAMFVNVPAIVYAHTIGGAAGRINPATGIFASDDELADKIVSMLERHADFSPRAWVLEHSGSAVATRVLNDAIRRTVLDGGGRYGEGIVEKTNSPNLAYKDSGSLVRFHSDYEFVLSCRRGAAKRSAVA